MNVTIHNRSATMAAQIALAEAQRACDNAVRSIFELAQSLEFLREAIVLTSLPARGAGSESASFID
jgi:hypothetical protein